MLTLRDIVRRPPVVAATDWSVGRVMELLLNEDVSTVLIVDERQRMVGLVTESPLLVAAFDPLVRHDPISLHMHRQFVSVDARATLSDAVEMILLHRVRHLPVLDRGVPIGIVSRRDLLRHVMQLQLSGASAVVI